MAEHRPAPEHVTLFAVSVMRMNLAIRSASTESSYIATSANVDRAAVGGDSGDGDGGSDGNGTVIAVMLVEVMMIKVFMVAVI